MNYINRHMERVVLSVSKQYPVVMVCGQRQVGKSTMLYHLKEENRQYVTMDDANARRLMKEDPALFFESYGYPILIDEFQRAPEMLLEIKRIVDELALQGKANEGLFWLTGSQKFEMMKNVSESLAGRVAVLELSSLSQGEIEGRSPVLFDPEITQLKERLTESQPQNIHGIFSKIFRGGMPRIVATDINRERYYSDYVNTYLERDIRDLAQVGKLEAFYQFLVYMAANTAQELKYNTIAKEVGVSAPTVKHWVSILESSGVIILLRPYYTKATDRLVKTPKMYFMDTGLAAYLTRWPNAETLENGNAAGAYFETFVVTEILKSYYNAGKKSDLYYYRDIDQHEIDLLIVKGDQLYPIEIKKAKTPTAPDKHLSILSKYNMQVQPMIVMCMSDTLVPYNRKCWLCPVWVL